MTRPRRRLAAIAAAVAAALASALCSAVPAAAATADYPSFTCSGHYTAGCTTTMPVTLTVENRTARALTVRSHEPQKNSRGSQVISKASDGVPAVTFGAALDVPADGTAAAGYAVTRFNKGNDTEHDQVTLRMDVNTPEDTSGFERLEITQRQRITGFAVTGIGVSAMWSHAVALTGDPGVSRIGGGTIRARIESTPGTKPVAATWRLILEDNTPTVAGTAQPTITRLTADWKETIDDGVWDSLKQPTYRIDIPAVTKTWSGTAPDRLAIEPTTVQALRGGTWEKLGTITPNSAASFGDGTITFGESSFYFRDRPGVEQATALRLTGGWLGDAKVPSFQDAPAPTIDLDGQSASQLALSSWGGGSSGTSALVPNGIDGDTVEVSVRVGSQHAAKDGPYGALYDYVYFEDRNGNLLTGLDSTTAPVVSVVKTRHGDTVPQTANSSHFVYVSTRSTSGNQIINPRLTVGNVRESGSASITVVSQPQGAQLDSRALALDESVGLTCTSAYTPCVIADGAGALYRDTGQTLRLLRSYQAYTRTSASASMFDKAATYQPGVKHITDRLVAQRYPYTGEWPGATRFELTLVLVSEAGEAAVGTVTVTKR